MNPIPKAIIATPFSDKVKNLAKSIVEYLFKKHKKKSIFLVFIMALVAIQKRQKVVTASKIFEFVANIVQKKMMKSMLDGQKKQDYFQRKNMCFQQLTQDFQISQISQLKTKLKEKFVQQFHVEEIKKQIKAEKNPQQKNIYWQNLNEEIFSFITLTLNLEHISIFCFEMSHILLEKYYDQLLDYFSEEQLGSIKKNIFSTITEDIISINLPKTVEFIKQEVKEVFQSVSVKESVDIQDLIKYMDIILKKMSVVSPVKQSQKKDQILNNPNKYYLQNSEKEIVDKFTQNPYEVQLQKDLQKEQKSIYKRLETLLGTSVATVKKVKNTLLSPFTLPENLKFNVQLSKKYLISQLLFDTTNIDLALLINNHIAQCKFTQQLNIQNPEINDILEANSMQNDNQNIGEILDNRLTAKGNKTIDVNGIRNEEIQDLQREFEIQKFGKKVEKGKQFLKLILLEFCDILQNSINYQILFHYQQKLSFLKFKNRYLLYLLKSNGVDQKKALALQLAALYKLCQEEFLSPNCEKNTEELLYQNRIKQALEITRKVGNNDKKENNGENSENSEKNSDENENEQEKENQIKEIEQEALQVSDDELRVNMRICEEIELSKLLEESEKQFLKRIFFEREKLEMDHKPGQQQQQQQQQDGNLLEQQFGQGQEDPLDGGLMDLISKLA